MDRKTPWGLGSTLGHTKGQAGEADARGGFAQENGEVTGKNKGRKLRKAVRTKLE